MSNPDQYFSKTFEKGLLILSLFDRDHPRWSLADISQTLGINKTSTYRLVNTLVQLGFLKKNPSTKLLKLGYKALTMGYNFLYGFDLLQSTKPLMDQIYKEHNITIDSALLDDYTLLALYRREAPNTISFRQPLTNKDLHARAMGKAVLAKLSETELDHFLETVELNSYTPNTLVTREELLADLEETRKKGYALNNEEYMAGLISIGTPLMNFQTNSVVGAISFDFPTSEQSLRSMERDYAGIIQKLSNDISEIITVAEA